MKFSTRLTLTTLCAALLPLLLAMMVSLWHSSRQLHVLTIESAQGHLRAGAEKLSGYFAQRITESASYANNPLVGTMDWQKIGPFLQKELKRHGGIYEKLVLGNPDSHYYVTSGGNPAYGGLASFDDSDPHAKLKSIASREYWQYLVGNNRKAEFRTYVSDPIISYTTGVRQVLVGATVLSAAGDKILGMVGGTIQWKEIESLVNSVRDEILKDFGRAAKLCLVTHSGIYTYHWDSAKVIHLQLDAQGQPILNEIGEKTAVIVKITDEPSAELARAGREMILGRSGIAFFTDPEIGQKMAVIYAPVRSANYSMAMMMPEDQIMAPVKSLRWFFIFITLASIGLSLAVSLILAKRVTSPVEALNAAAKDLAKGNWQTRLTPIGSDEVSQLARAFNEMADSLEKREGALKESEEKYRLLVKNLPNIIYKGYLDWSVEFVDNKIELLTGYTKDEFNSRKIKWADIVVKEDIKGAKDSFIRALKTNTSYVREYRIKARSGKILWIQERASIVCDDAGQAQYVSGIFFDITDKKHAEQALRESEEEYKKLYQESKRAEEVYRSLLHSSADAIVIYDMNGSTGYVSPAFTQTFGWTLEEVKGKHIPFLPESEREDTLAIFKDLAENGTTCHGFETKRYTKDGCLLDISISASRYHDHENKPAGMLEVLRDISKKKRLEAQLQQAQRLEAIGTLAGGIAHDFNNLMMGMLGNVSLILSDIETTHQHYQKLKKIEKLIQNASKLTNQLLGYARKGTYEVKPVSVNQIVAESAETFGRTKKEITIHRELAEDLFAVNADEAQLQQVLLNLYINAADAMPGGGDLFLKTINVTHREMKDKSYAPKPGDYVLIKVTDHGTGMDAKTAERIFDPFFTTKEMGRGTGLGLASAYGIIKGHGGYIDVDTEKGRGTTFSIYLPASNRPIPKTFELPDRIKKGDETVLLVDDEEVVFEVGSQMLERLGYRVLGAKSGREALEIYAKNRYTIDLVILDMIMPETGGGEAYDRLKELDADVKVLLSSGYSINGQATEILRRGCNGFIQKPFNIKDLSQKIREILDPRLACAKA